MTLVTLIWRNLWRRPTRTLLTIGSLAFSLFLLTILAATVDCMNAVAAESGSQLRLVVHHKTTVTKLLPLGHGPKLDGIPGVRTVCAMRWFGGRLEDRQEQFPSMAVDPLTFPRVFSDFDLSDSVLAEWGLRRAAAVVGVGLARRLGWSNGDRVTLKGTVPPYLGLEFRVVGITRASAYPNVFVFRLDYLLDALRTDPMMPTEHDDAVNLYWVQATSPDVLDSVRREVDRLFANSADSTMTELEESFVANFTKMFGDIPRLVRRVGWIVVASILLVLCNTLSATARERMADWALLKAVGFPTFFMIMLLLGEAVLMGLIGCAGCVVAFLLYGLFESNSLNIPYFPRITVSPLVAVLMSTTGVMLNLAAAALPSRRVARLSVVETLRGID